MASARLSSCSNDPKSSSWIEQHAQPLASSIVSARSDVVLLLLFPLLLALFPSPPTPPPRCLDLSLRTSLASMLTSATSLTTQPILRLSAFWRRWRRTVVLPVWKILFFWWGEEKEGRRRREKTSGGVSGARALLSLIFFSFSARPLDCFFPLSLLLSLSHSPAPRKPLSIVTGIER